MARQQHKKNPETHSPMAQQHQSTTTARFLSRTQPTEHILWHNAVVPMWINIVTWHFCMHVTCLVCGFRIVNKFRECSLVCSHTVARCMTDLCATWTLVMADFMFMCTRTERCVNCMYLITAPSNCVRGTRRLVVGCAAFAEHCYTIIRSIVQLWRTPLKDVCTCSLWKSDVIPPSSLAFEQLNYHVIELFQTVFNLSRTVRFLLICIGLMSTFS